MGDVVGRARVRHRRAAVGPWVDVRDGTAVAFGAVGCALDLTPSLDADARHRDPEAPALAGWLVGAHGRVMVEANGGARRGGDLAARRALEVTAGTGPSVPIAAASVYSPAVATFVVTIRGAIDVWDIDVEHAVAPDATESTADADDPTIIVDLSEIERQVVAAYAAPLLDGRIEPATHDEVASRVHLSRSQVRRVLGAVDRRFSDLHLWAPDTPDHRVRVVEAARHNDVLDALRSDAANGAHGA